MQLRAKDRAANCYASTTRWPATIGATVKSSGWPSKRRFPSTDTGLAERFAAQHGNTARYCHPWGKWLTWDGTRWKIDEAGAIDQLGKLTVRSLLREAADEADDVARTALAKFARQSESAIRRAAMLRLAQSEPPIPILPDALDRDPGR